MGKSVGTILGGLEVAVGIGLLFVPGMQGAGIALIAAGAGTLAASFVKQPGQPDYTQAAQDNRHTFRAAVTPHKIIYGQARISGPLYELGSTGASNEFLHVIIPLAGHELESIGNIIINNILMDGIDADAKYAPYVRVKRHFGGVGQVADADLIAEFPEWTTAHVGNGIAYLYVRLKFNKDLFPSGIKNIQADVKGKKLFDPRTQSIAWTDNWALCMRDYMSEAFGLGLSDAEIDDNYIIAAANISEEILATANGGSQNRYTLNGMVDLSHTPTNNIKAMLTAGAGNLVPLVEGKARLIPGAYATPTVSLSDSDLRGAIKYQPHANRKSLFNTVTGKYAGEDSGWQVLSYPQVGDQAAVTADGQEIRREISLPYCTDHERCQRIAKLVLNQHRASGTLSMPCKLTAIEAATMEVVLVTLSSLGFVDRPFRVVSWNLTPELGVDLQLKEDNAAIYAWQQSDATPFVALPAALPNTGPVIVQPGIPIRVNGLELAGQGNNTEFTGPDAHFVWRHATALDYQGIGTEIFGAGSGGFDAWFMGYEIKILAGATIVYTDFTSNNFYDFTFLKNAASVGGPYREFTIEVRIKGKQNQISQAAMMTVKNPSPVLPSGLQIIPGFQNAEVSFTAPSDLDFAGTLIYLSSTTGFTPSPATLVYDGPDTRITLGNLTSGSTYYMLMQPYDRFGKTGLQTSSELTVTTLQIMSADINPGDITNILLDPAGIVADVPVLQSDVVTLQSTVGANSANISSEATIRGNADNLMAQSIQTVTTTVDGNTATIQTHATSINGITAQYAVRLDVNGHVVGFGLINDGVNGLPSTFTVVADKFELVDPLDKNNTTAPFAVDSSGNVHFGGVLDAAAGSFAGALQAATGTFAGSLSAVTGSFIGSVNVGSFTGYAWPTAGLSGAHLSSFGALFGNANGGGKYFQIYTPAGADAYISTNIPFVNTVNINDAQVNTLKIGANAATILISANATAGMPYQATTIGMVLEHPSSVLVIGNTLMPLTNTISLQYSPDGVTFYTLTSSTLTGGSSGSLSYTISLSPGTWYFRMTGGGSNIGTTVSAFASIR